MQKTNELDDQQKIITYHMYEEVHLTGFKKFGEIAVNPTELIVDDLTSSPIPHVHPTKLDVTVDEVDKYIVKKVQEQCKSDKKILNIHFGVGPNKVYFLQNCAYNNKDFRIPDNSGKQFLKEKICQKLELDEPLKTQLDLKELEEKLSVNHKVKISTDPGRYLCNYVYFNSLNELKCEKNNVDCLFVHFPNLNVTSHEENMNFVKDLLGQLIMKK